MDKRKYYYRGMAVASILPLFLIIIPTMAIYEGLKIGFILSTIITILLVEAIFSLIGLSKKSKEKSK